MRMYKRNKEYEAFSLIEMLITMAILGIIFITCALVLTTLIKVSTVSTNKMRVRSESEYIQELLKRTIRTTEPQYANIYNSSTMRIYNPENGKVVDYGRSNNPYSPLVETEIGNEIHLKSFGSNRWVCVGFFYGVDNEMESDGETKKGYILKTTMDVVDYSPSNCFNPAKNAEFNYILLNSKYVNISEMKVSYRETEDKNKEFILDIHADAINWYFAKGAPLKRDLYRQSIIKTESIMW